MDKLEYDSLHKFIVSLGLIFIALPLFILYAFYNKDLTLISQDEFAQLSDFSQNQVFQYEKMTRHIAGIPPWVCVVLFVIGVILLIIGIRNWKRVQKTLDGIQEKTLQNMTNSEKLDQACEEVQESNDPSVVPAQTAQIELSGIKNYLDIEDRYFASVQTDTFKRRYSLRRNIRIGKFDYDGIAISSRDNIDLIYELKYWKQPRSASLINQTANRLFKAGVNYETVNHRNFRCILIIVTGKDSIEQMRHDIEHTFSCNTAFDLSKIEVKYIAEEAI